MENGGRFAMERWTQGQHRGRIIYGVVLIAAAIGAVWLPWPRNLLVFTLFALWVFFGIRACCERIR